MKGWIGLICLCLMMVGCGKSKQHKDLHQFVEETKKTPAQPIEPLPTFKAPEKFNYSSIGLRNPFTKAVQRLHSQRQPDLQRSKESLETYSLDSLKMMGILAENHKIWGVVVAPDDTVYRVTVGNYLGQNYGQITAITPTEIKILETIPQGEDWLQRESSLVLN